MHGGDRRILRTEGPLSDMPESDMSDTTVVVQFSNFNVELNTNMNLMNINVLLYL